MSSDHVSAKDVYEAINGLRGEVKEDQKVVWDELKDLRARDDEVAKCVQMNKLELEKHNGRLHTHAAHIKNVKLTADKIDKHVENKEVHFDKELAKTTKLGYIAKKKFLAAVLTLMTLIVTLVTTWMMNKGGP
jgi:hypothetical protein